MPTKIKTWEIKGKENIEKIDTSLEDEGRREREDLQKWIIEDPEIIHENLEILDSEVYIEGKPIDILGFLPEGSLVVVELKRGKSPRETVAQAIDYASKIAELETNNIQDVLGVDIERKLKKMLQSRDMELSDLKEEPRILIVASEIDEATRSMIDYLSEIYEVPINGILFTYTKLSDGCEVLTRTAVVSEEEFDKRVSISIQELKNIAENEGFFEILEILSNSSLFVEDAYNAKTWGKSLRYWTEEKNKIPFGIKVEQSQKGDVEIWIRHETIADMEGAQPQEVLDELKKDFHVKYHTTTRTDLILKDKSETKELRNWLENKVGH